MPRGSKTGVRPLRAAATAWFVVTFLGQLVFAAYLVAIYGRLGVAGRFEDWNLVLPSAYVPGNTAGNLLVGLHLGFAVVVLAGGGLQLVPAVRRRWPAFHRWNGRLYLAAAAVMGAGGLAMMATRDTDGGLSTKLGTATDGLLTIVCAATALAHARARRLDAHRRWALRLFLVANGVWYLRLGIFFWLMVNRGAVGFDPDGFTGPFLVFIHWAQFGVPLVALELYLGALCRGGPRRRIAVAALLVALTAVTAAGTVAATRMMWWPRIERLA